jgi:hypothetical protein
VVRRTAGRSKDTLRRIGSDDDGSLSIEFVGDGL